MIVHRDPLPLTRTCFGRISDICYAWPVFATPQFEQFMKRVIVIGAGGHGREVADILRHQAQNESDLEIHGFVDEDPALDHKVINGLPVLGNWSWFEAVDRSEMAVLCAVGSPEIRKQLVERARLIGLSFVNAISPLAHISPSAQIGEGVMMFPYSVAGANSFVGDHAIVNVAATISHDTKIGRYGTLNPGVHLAGNVTVSEGCQLGLSASVVHGVSIGSWTTIGAGAVVLRDLPERVTAVGVPARVIKTKELHHHESPTGLPGK
jgi:sugar O-acyltransferase (sialic acid O-acetyltransferase NeuD family)